MRTFLSCALGGTHCFRQDKLLYCTARGGHRLAVPPFPQWLSFGESQHELALGKNTGTFAFSGGTGLGWLHVAQEGLGGFRHWETLARSPPLRGGSKDTVRWRQLVTECSSAVKRTLPGGAG